MVHFKKWLLNIAVLSLGVFLTLFVLEIGIRLFAVKRVYEFPKGLFVSDELLDYRMASNFTGRHLSANYEWDVVIKTNSEGFWDYEHGPKDGKRILGVGDSFTFPFGVGFEKGYLGVIEQKLDVEVIKAGVSGYAPSQYLNYIQARGLKYNPDLVVLGFYVGNDIHVNVEPQEKVASKDGVLVQQETKKVPRLDGFWRRFAKSVPGFLREHYHTYGFVMDRIKSSPSLRRIINLVAEDMRKLTVPELVLMNKSEDLASNNEIWKKTEEILVAIHTAVNEHDAILLVVIIPTDYQVYDEKWARVASQYELDVDLYDRTLPNQKLRRICQRNNIPTLDLLPVFKETARQEKQLYFVYNRHWSVSGNLLAGTEIVNYIKQNSLLGTDRSTQ